MSDKTQNTRSVSSIARDIRADWGSKVNFAARPYLQAMLSIDSTLDSFGHDSGDSIVRYFLCTHRPIEGKRRKH